MGVPNGRGAPFVLPAFVTVYHKGLPRQALACQSLLRLASCYCQIVYLCIIQPYQWLASERPMKTKAKSPPPKRKRHVLFIAVTEAKHRQIAELAEKNSRTIGDEVMRRLMATLEHDDWESRLNLNPPKHIIPVNEKAAQFMGALSKPLREAIGKLVASEKPDTASITAEFVSAFAETFGETSDTTSVQAKTDVPQKKRRKEGHSSAPTQRLARKKKEEKQHGREVVTR